MAKKNFEAFTIAFNGLSRRIITEVAVCEAFDPKNPPTPLPKFLTANALWDTGATGSVIADDLAKRLGLTPTGTAQVNHAGGKGQFPTYVVNLGLPNKVRITGVQVTGCPVQPGFDAIVGMDVMSLGDLALTHFGGKTVMSFRIPSIHCVDFVKEAKRRKAAGIGRNDPCPCGSGKKFKKCHMRELLG